MCELAALAPESVLPVFRTIIGFLGITFSAELAKILPFLTPSMYIAMTFVSGSSAKYSKRSLSVISIAFP